MTSKEALQRIGEYSEAAITIRGTYFPPGKEPKEGERKIYLAIESTYNQDVCWLKTQIHQMFLLFFVFYFFIVLVDPFRFQCMLLHEILVFSFLSKYLLLFLPCLYFKTSFT